MLFFNTDAGSDDEEEVGPRPMIAEAIVGNASSMS